MKEICNIHGVRAYDEQKHKGELRHIMARYGLKSGEVMVVLVTRTNELTNKKKIIEEIVKTIPGVKSIVQNINSKKTNVIFGEETKGALGRRSDL